MQRRILGFIAAAVLSLGQVGAADNAANAGPAVAGGAVAAQLTGDGSVPRLPRWLTLGGEIRGRGEYDSGVSYTARDDGYYLSRARLNVGIQMHSLVRFAAQIQDSRVGGWDTSAIPPAGVQDKVDLRLVNVRIGDADDGALELVAGRQELAFGSRRLIGTSGWGNVSPTFDGARLTQHLGNVRIHYLAVTRVRPLSDGLDRYSSASKLFGTYGSWKSGDGRTEVEPYWLATTFRGRLNELGVRGGEEVHTFGARLVRQGKAGMVYEGEILTQRGELAGAPISAWGAHASVAHGFDGWRGTPLFFADYSFASGDRNRLDGRQRTLRQIFPTHKWGTADNIAWRNIHEPLVGVDLHPHRRWRTTLRFRELFLASRQDAVYSFSGAEWVRNAAATSSHIGEELELQVNFKYSSRLDFLGGCGHVFQGAYLKQSRPDHGVGMAYLMWAYKL
jgi:Alginate export